MSHNGTLDFGQFYTPDKPKKQVAAESIYEMMRNITSRFCNDGVWGVPFGFGRSLQTNQSRDKGRDQYKFSDIAQLDQIRMMARLVADSPIVDGVYNAINNFVIGTGLRHDVVPKKGREVSPELIKVLNDRIDAFQRRYIESTGRRVLWPLFQREYVKSRFTDGEVIIRKFRNFDGMHIRIVPPETLRNPTTYAATEMDGWFFGVLCNPNDSQSVIGYNLQYYDAISMVHDVFVSKDDISFDAVGTAITCSRGISELANILEDSDQLDKILNSLAVGQSIRARIAFIRSVQDANAESLENFADQMAEIQSYDAERGKVIRKEKVDEGSIINAGNVNVTTLPQGNALETIEVIKQLIRIVFCVKFGLPEFIGGADASNANYASTMVAGGPAVRSFTAIQSVICDRFKLLYEDALAWDAEIGLAPNILEDVEIKVTGPLTHIVDRQKEVAADMLLVNANAMSLPTLQKRHELDPDEENEQIQLDRERYPEKDPMQMMELDSQMSNDSKASESIEWESEHHATQTGPRGGKFHLGDHGQKVYEELVAKAARAKITDLGKEHIHLWHGTTEAGAKGIVEKGIHEGLRGKNATISAKHASQYPEDTGAHSLVLFRAKTSGLTVDPNDQVGKTVEDGLFPRNRYQSSTTLGEANPVMVINIEDANSPDEVIAALDKGNLKMAIKHGAKITWHEGIK